MSLRAGFTKHDYLDPETALCLSAVDAIREKLDLVAEECNYEPFPNTIPPIIDGVYIAVSPAAMQGATEYSEYTLATRIGIQVDCYHLMGAFPDPSGWRMEQTGNRDRPPMSYLTMGVIAAIHSSDLLVKNAMDKHSRFIDGFPAFAFTGNFRFRSAGKIEDVPPQFGKDDEAGTNPMAFRRSLQFDDVVVFATPFGG